MKKILILSLLFSSANVFAWGCNETKAGDRLIERVERIREDCIQQIKRESKTDYYRPESSINFCQLDAQIVIQQSIKFVDGEDPTLRELEEARDIVDRYDTDIKRKLGIR